MQQDLKPLNYADNYEGILPDGAIRISPSMLSKFMSDKSTWYRNQVLGEETFAGNTATILGTCVHRAGELATKMNIMEVLDYMETEIPNYVNDQRINPDVDADYVLSQWYPMASALVSHLSIFGIPDKAEYKVKLDLGDNIYLCGTYDAMLKDTLIDYKTTSKLTAPDDIPSYYRVQLLAYAYALRKSGIEVNNIRIIWITNNVVGRISEKTGKPMKDYPSVTNQVTEVITDDDMVFIENYLKLIADSVKLVKEKPELAYLLFSDYSLKDKNESN